MAARSLQQSDALWARAERVLAGGAATYSKHATRYPPNAPKFFVRGDGCYVWDSEGVRYLDTVAALGPILCGYRFPAVDEAVQHQLKQGASFSLLHPLEVEVAELLCECIPSAEQVRFGRNGMDVTNAAIRVARTVTGRKHILCSGYHGGADFYLISTEKTSGLLPDIAPYTHRLPWGDRAFWQHMFAALGAMTAAVIVEVPPQPWGEDTAGDFLRFLREQATKYGIVFILDEVVTGWRQSLGGAQAYYQVTPDLSCFSKALGNGHAIAALAGKREIMHAFQSRTFFSTTFGGETIGLAAAKAVLTTLRDTRALQNLREQGEKFGNALHHLIQEYKLPAVLLGNFSRLCVQWHTSDGGETSAELKTLWLQENIHRGIFHGPGVMFPMTCWDDAVVETLLHTASETLSVIAHGLETSRIHTVLHGPVLQDVFAQRYATTRKAL